MKKKRPFKQINVAMIEDSEVFRNIIRMMLSNNDEFKLVAEYSDAETALESKLKAPHIILLDIDFGSDRMSGVQAIEKLKAKWPSVTLLIITVHNENPTIFDALRAGANGYLTKDVSPEQLQSAIKEVHLGGSVVSPDISKKIIQHFQIPFPKKSRLTKQERRILKLASTDKTDSEIASLIKISHDTVRFHFKNIYKKLNVHSKHGAIAKAIKFDLF